MTPLELVTAPMTARGRQSQEPCFAEQCIEQKPQAETDKELQGGGDNAFPYRAAGHLYINGSAAAEQKQANQGLGTPFLNRPEVKPPMVRALGKKVIHCTSKEQGNHHHSCRKTLHCR